VSGIAINDTTMTSPDTPHTATTTGGGWKVSWLPGRTLDRNQATTAMVIASIVGGRGADLSEDPIWPFLESWAAELGLSGPDAVARADGPPVPDSPAASGTVATGPPSGGARLWARADRDGTGARWLLPGQACQQAETSQEPEAGT
jgi:hypothetical protein